MTDWVEFLKDVRPKAPGVAQPVAEHAVKRAVQQFCEDSRAWVVDLDPVTTREGVLEYDIELPSSQELVRIEGATLNGQTYGIWRPEGVRAARDSRHVYTPDARVIVFASQPEAGVPLVLRCAVSPSERATGVDRVIYERYVRTIAKLAIADLTGDAGKRMEYEADVARIKTRLWRGNAAIAPRAISHSF